ncbi:MAG: hypothetical protein MJZ20_11635 [Bacteroidaceae bacterium]|nr:hypothetical protein [Bacteroidaceae bacterium]
MQYKALISFCGLENMVKGQVKELPDNDITKDLLRCGYIVTIEETPKTTRGRKSVKGVK